MTAIPEPRTPESHTVWQANAAAFAQQSEQAADHERRAAVRKAVALLAQDPPKPGRALYELARSVERQARILGAGSAVGVFPVDPTCPCGGRCPHGTNVPTQRGAR